MKVLVVGHGGREHALCWKLAQSPRVEQVYCAPGNPGIAEVAERVDLKPHQHDAIASFVHAHKIDLTVIGPEQPLCDGLADRIRRAGYVVFGPGKDAARLEGSKSYAKGLAQQHNIPSPGHKVFTSSRAALDYLERAGDFPMVIKADGLAGGKGVRICQDLEQAKAHLADCMEGSHFGEAGRKVVIEEAVKGQEVSVQVITGGSTLLPLEPARDYKAAYDGDEGPNTGGMGAYSPAPIRERDMGRIEEKILVPTVHAMNREGHPFTGLLYVGLMLTPTGPRLLEYNVRFGDPEAQVTLVRLRSDLFELLWEAAQGKLERAEVEWDPRHAVCVSLCAEGYPEVTPRQGATIHGVEAAAAEPDVWVFHAGTERRAERLVTAGGRVLSVTALGETLEEAREKAYAAVRKISFDGMSFRQDIAQP